MFTTTTTTTATINVTLGDAELWKEFSAIENEMIVMKKGRSLFPLLNYNVNGLVPELQYAVKLHMEVIDDKRYRFDKGQWSNALRADPRMENRQVYHSDGVKSGAEWMRFPIGFKNVKLSNDMTTTQAMHIPLQTMRKYLPVLTIIQVRTDSLTGQIEHQCQQEFRLPHTEFIAVTAYQNKSIISLKTANNKYAKQFREGTKKRQRTETPEDPQTTAAPTQQPAPKRTPLTEITHQQSMPQMPYQYNDYNQPQYAPDCWNQQYCEWPAAPEYNHQEYYYPPQQQPQPYEYYNCN